MTVYLLSIIDQVYGTLVALSAIAGMTSFIAAVSMIDGDSERPAKAERVLRWSVPMALVFLIASMLVPTRRDLREAARDAQCQAGGK